MEIGGVGVRFADVQKFKKGSTLRTVKTGVRMANSIFRGTALNITGSIKQKTKLWT